MRGQWAVVQDTIEIADDPQVVANGYLQQLECDGYPYKLVETPVQFDEETSVPGKSPDFNEHGDQILTEQLGLDWDTVLDLKVQAASSHNPPHPPPPTPRTSRSWVSHARPNFEMFGREAGSAPVRRLSVVAR